MGEERGGGGGDMHGRQRRKQKLLCRKTKGEKYSRAGEKMDKRGEITEAASWKLARTFKIS